MANSQNSLGPREVAIAENEDTRKTISVHYSRIRV